jgi:shikimate dehydrogenase
MRKFGLIGQPLEHSFSKKYFTEKFEKLGLKDCVYLEFPLESISGIVDILKEHPDLIGLNVTIPYKQQIMRRLNSVARIPHGIYACNCIKMIEGKLFGYNTDIVGFEKSLVPLLQPFHKKALVLGNGGAAAAVLYVLKKIGIEYEVVSRQLHEGSTLTYADLDETIIHKHQLIIHTTPLGMAPNEHAAPPIPYEYLGNQHICYDLIYNPAETLFLQRAKRQGATIKNGAEMLVLQAEESWEIWNRAEPSVAFLIF